MIQMFIVFFFLFLHSKKFQLITLQGPYSQSVDWMIYRRSVHLSFKVWAIN